MIVPQGSPVTYKITLTAWKLRITLLTVLCWAVFGVGVPISMMVSRVNNENIETYNIAAELRESTNQLDRAMANAQSAVKALLEANQEQSGELSRLQARYESLKALTEGQEEIARAHRKILREVSPFHKMLELTAVLTLGILSSLSAMFLWKAWSSTKKVPGERENIEFENSVDETTPKSNSTNRVGPRKGFEMKRGNGVQASKIITLLRKWVTGLR